MADAKQVKSTSIKLRGDAFKSITSTAAGHNNDAIAFNIALITEHYPHHVSSLMRIYSELPLYLPDEPLEGEAVEAKQLTEAEEITSNGNESNTDN